MNARFERDRFTWLAYGMLAYFSFAQAVLGPLTPFLRDELRISYTVAGMHLSAVALGVTLIGTVADELIGRMGPRLAFWLSGAGVSAGLLLLVSGQHPVVTILGTALTGVTGGVLLVTSQAGLSDRHSTARTVAIAEASIAASLAASAAPLLVGGFAQAGLGWRGAILVVVIAWVLALIFGWRESPPDSAPTVARNCSRSSGLPAMFWAYGLVLMMLMAVQWSISLWGASYLRATFDFSAVKASSLVWVYLIAIVLGRWVVSRLARDRSGEGMLVVSIGLALAGFGLFWLSNRPLPAVLGFFATGIGVANFYPLALSLALNTVPEQAGAASARASTGVGAAMLIVPQTLGWLADQTGIRGAFGLLLILLPLSGAVTLFANRLAARHNLG